MSRILERIQEFKEKYKKLKELDEAGQQDAIRQLYEKLRGFCEVNFNEKGLIDEITKLRNLPYKSEEYIGSKEYNAKIINTKINRFYSILLRLEERQKEIDFKESQELSRKETRRCKLVQVPVSDRNKSAKNFYDKSQNHYEKAEGEYEKKSWAESIRHYIYSMEHSIKLIFTVVLGKYPESHDFQEDICKSLFKELKNKISSDYKGIKEDIDISRISFIPHFWTEDYKWAEYGNEFGQPSELYGEDEAKLAKLHAEELSAYSCLIYPQEQKN